MINVLHKPHEELQARVERWLARHEFVICRDTYHERLPPPFSQRLATIDSEVSLRIRGRADGAAAHRTLPLVLLYECKTGSEKYPNWSLEIMPLLRHMHDAKLELPRARACLYIFHDPYRDRPDVGFWADWQHLPHLDKIRVPNQSRNPGSRTTAEFRDLLTSLFPETPVEISGPTGGSGDPFALISEGTIRGLPPWKRLLRRCLRQYRL
jgi:hypothetical protein